MSSKINKDNTKKCPKCGETKDILLFTKSKVTRAGGATRYGCCLKCEALRHKMRGKQGPKQLGAYQAERYYAEVLQSKLCKTCKIVKDKKDFHPDRGKLLNVSSVCKTCHAHYCKQNYRANITERKNYAKLKRSLGGRNERIAYAKAWRAKNPNYTSVASKQYKLRFPEKVKTLMEIWRKANPDKLKANYHKRRARKINAEGEFSAEEWISLKDRTYYRCVKCLKQLKAVGTKYEKPVADHIVPLSRGGSDYITNIQPLCWSCNSQKYVSDINYMLDFEDRLQAKLNNA